MSGLRCLVGWNLAVASEARLLSYERIFGADVLWPRIIIQNLLEQELPSTGCLRISKNLTHRLIHIVLPCKFDIAGE